MGRQIIDKSSVKDAKFITSLGGLRALAALAVAINHCMIVFSVNGNKILFMYPPFSDLRHSGEIIVRAILLLLGNGYLAVTFFFTLSGFLMGLSFDRHAMNIVSTPLHFLKNHIRFGLRRVFRIFPAHLVVLLLITVYINFVHRPITADAASGWYYLWYRSDITVDQFFRSAFFINSMMNPVTWVLKYHMVAILLVPFLYLFIRRFSVVTNIALLVLLYNMYFQFKVMPFLFMCIFGLGLLITNIKSHFEAIDGRTKKALIFLTLIYIVIPRSTLIPIFSNGNGYAFYESGHIEIFEAIGCMLLIGLLSYGRNSSIFGILDHRFLQHLGKISYSFFLVHMPVMFILATLFIKVNSPFILNYPVCSSLLLSASSISLSIAVAHFIYNYIEYPVIRIFRHVSHISLPNANTVIGHITKHRHPGFTGSDHRYSFMRAVESLARVVLSMIGLIKKERDKSFVLGLCLLFLFLFGSAISLLVVLHA